MPAHPTVTAAPYGDGVRHVTDADLDRLDDLLGQLRTFPGLRERKRGNFQLESRAFLHFHSHGDDLYADVRLDGVDFSRHRVTTREEQADLVAVIAAAVGG
jgi:hypothetical protein